MRAIDADALTESIGCADAVKYGNRDRAQQDTSYSTMMLYEIKDEIDAQPTIGGWISVKDRLPDEKLNPYTKDYQEVICLLNTRLGCDVRVYKFGRGHFLHDGFEIDKYITHWMPLPEPPKEETECNTD